MSTIKVDTVSNTGGTKSVSVDDLVKVDSGVLKDLDGNEVTDFGGVTIANKATGLEHYISISSSSYTDIAPAQGHTSYLVGYSMNYGTGNSVRSGLYFILTNNEGDAIASNQAIATYNSPGITFQISGGYLQAQGTSGNNKVFVVMN